MLSANIHGSPIKLSWVCTPRIDHENDGGGLRKDRYPPKDELWIGIEV